MYLSYVSITSRTPPGVRELKPKLNDLKYLGNAGRTPPGVRELKQPDG